MGSSGCFPHRVQVEFYVNENTFKERLKLFFIKNQRSSECSEGEEDTKPAELRAGSVLTGREAIAICWWLSPACPQCCCCPLAFLLGLGPSWFGRMWLRGEEGMLPTPLLAWDKHSMRPHWDKLAQSRVAIRSCLERVREQMSPNGASYDPCACREVSGSGDIQGSCELPATAIRISLHLTNGVYIFFL